ncbi:ABC-three component system protein [Shewanella sp. YLB-07]|uniref:ABC-three component system protein n=1 Tax=Shewanella sp. YLB-07 TaxID=2601268 RepID=UPI00128DDB80|nr:ABC-three component system protein [Shewanella sp. YLB-07]MPY24423.1 hypothetical protein [Shewanella sp. YLB-07]
MADTVKSVLHDATPSWNGYNYQGKIGLYVCLVNISREAQAGIDLPAFDVFLDEHHIEYEWIEDFSIKKNEDYLSLHQVKHKAANNFTDHVDAIATILHRKNGVLSDTDIFKYFKIKSQKSGDAAALKAAIKSEINNNNLIDDNDLLDSNWEEKIKSVDSQYRENLIKCFTDFELLLQKAFNSSITYFHTSEEVDISSADISQVKGIPSHLVGGLTNPKSLAEMDIFLSFDKPTAYNLALSDDALNAEVEHLINELLQKIHIGTSFGDAEVKLYKAALCALLDQSIVTRHQHIRDKRDNDIPYLQRIKPTLSFKAIVNELREDYRVHNAQYWNLICRENFETAYSEQLDELYQEIKSSTSEAAVESYRQFVFRLEFVRINIIEDYFPDDCIGFLRQIYPHKILGDNVRQFYEAISEPEKIKNVFLDFIQQIIKPSGELTLNCPNNISKYQPSCINFNLTSERRKKIEINTVKKGLVDNHGNQSAIDKNVDYIVVNSTDANDVFSAGIEKITEICSYKNSPPKAKESDKYTNGKDIKFMDSRRAFGEING